LFYSPDWHSLCVISETLAMPSCICWFLLTFARLSSLYHKEESESS
jgi:hypothetical protein